MHARPSHTPHKYTIQLQTVQCPKNESKYSKRDEGGNASLKTAGTQVAQLKTSYKAGRISSAIGLPSGKKKI